MSEARDVWTVLDVILWSEAYLAKKDIESPRFEVEILLAEVLATKRLNLYLQFERVLKKEELASFKKLLLRRAAHEPSAYLLGRKEFYGLPFKVNSSVLIPRPETEHLVDAVLAAMKGIAKPVIVDVGTGSGNICAALAMAIPGGEFHATDISRDAIAVARDNINALRLGNRIKLYEGDLFLPLPKSLAGHVTAVVSNPPYIGEEEKASLPVEVRDFEPKTALFAGEKGLDVIRRLVGEAGSLLATGGLIALEIGSTQAEKCTHLLTEAGFNDITVIRDYAGLNRVLTARK